MGSGKKRRQPSTQPPAPAPPSARVGRLRLAAIATLLIAGAFGIWIWRAGAGSQASGPIVLVSIDTLRADRLPAYGYKRVRTPAIDALAAAGVVFERAYAHAPQTLPSHASIFSGKLPFEHGVRDNVGFLVREGERLLPSMLRPLGFTSAGFASAFVLRRDSGIAQGFDTYDGEIASDTPGASMGQVQRDGAATLQLVDAWLDRQTSPAFFLFVHFYEPHKPYRPPDRYASYADPYDGEVAYSDELLGRLVRSLQTRGFYDDATVILLADHGEGLGDHGEQEHGVFLYDESIRVPLIVKRPGSRSAGRRVQAPVQHIDIVPTVLELAGAAAAPGLSGRSLVAAMDGPDPQLAHRGIYSEALYPRYHFGWSELYALTDDRYRFIDAPQPELYDLQRDPRERENLERERPQTAASMQAAVRRFRTAGPIEKPREVSADEMEKFQALGYVGAGVDAAAQGEASQVDPKDKIHVLELYREAVTRRSERRFVEAAALYRKILDDSPTMVDIWLQLSQTLLRIGRTEEAVQSLRRAIELRPESTEALISMAHALLRLGRAEEAARHAELVIPRNAAAGRELLARIAIGRRDFAEAMTQARLAQEADPDLPMAAYIQGRIHYERGEYEAALPHFERAATASRERKLTIRDLHFQRADTLARLERSAEAEAAFREELKAFPESTAARASLAALYHSQGRIRERNETLEDLLRAVPAPESYAVVVQTLGILGDRENARAVLARGMRTFPDSRRLRGMTGTR
jgi:arylsulfatase A-like enzyme/cytochrome c-type biogenesis protein CcmH/NrfG